MSAKSGWEISYIRFLWIGVTDLILVGDTGPASPPVGSDIKSSTRAGLFIKAL